MKRLIIATLSIILVCMIINSAILTVKSEEDPKSVNRTYIIKNYEGKVACFEENSSSPFMITEIFVINLPPLDREMLKDGIKIIGAKNLSRALEDYRT